MSLGQFLKRFACLGAWLAALAVGASIVLVARSASAVTVRVRGSAKIDLIATTSATEVTIRGQVSDDVGASLGKTTVRIEALDAENRLVRLPPGVPCAGGGDARGSADPVRNEGDAYVVSTTERGDFCVKKPGDAAGVTFRARFVGNNFIEPGEGKATAAPESEQRAHTILKFESPPTEIDLERDTTNVTVSIKVDRADSDRLAGLGTLRREGLPVTLKDERGETLAKANTGGDGRARFELKSSSLAPPGNGELRAEFAGDGPLGAASSTTPVMRSATVHLSASDPDRADPEAGIPVDVEVASDHGVVDGGIVEALIGPDSVGTAPVSKGKAHVVASFVGGHRAEFALTLRYIPSAPWWRAGRDIQVVAAVAGPSLWRHVVLGALVLALAAWIVAKWRRSPETVRADSSSLPPPSGRPEIVVVDRPSGIKGWKGTVTDAHESSPIAGATLRITAPTFEGNNTLADAVTDEMGAFEIQLDPSLEGHSFEGARLVVEGEEHATFEQALPPQSLLRVALVTRRRAMLDRLVKWARTRGGAFDGAKEPTPGHVRRVASRAAAVDVEAWARRVEHAAFGPDAVDRRVHREVDEIEPKAVPLVLPGGAAGQKPQQQGVLGDRIIAPPPPDGRAR